MKPGCALFVILGVASAACSLTSLDGLSGGAVEAGSGGDASSDGSTGDAGADADGTSGPFCTTLARTPSFCADFDDGAIPTRLETVDVGGGTVVVEREGMAGSRAVTFAIAAHAQQEDGACLKLALGADPMSVIVEGDVRVSARGTSDFDVFTVNGDSAGELGIHLVGNQLEFEEDVAIPGGGEDTKITSAKRSLDGAFHRVRLSMIRQGATVHTELFVDGTLAASYEATRGPFVGSPALELGDCTFIDSRSWRVHLDNVVVDLK